MLTRSEKTYLAMTLAFLAAGCGLKAWRRASIRLGPFPDTTTLAQDSARADSLARPEADSPPGADSAVPLATDRPPADGDSPAAPSQPSRIARSERKSSPSGPGSSGKIDLNRADAAGLMRIKGVGEKTAEAILAYRRAHGAFRDVRELLQIKGIGEKKLEKLTPHIIL